MLDEKASVARVERKKKVHFDWSEDEGLESIILFFSVREDRESVGDFRVNELMAGEDE